MSECCCIAFVDDSAGSGTSQSTDDDTKIPSSEVPSSEAEAQPTTADSLVRPLRTSDTQKPPGYENMEKILTALKVDVAGITDDVAFSALMLP